MTVAQKGLTPVTKIDKKDIKVLHLDHRAKVEVKEITEVVTPMTTIEVAVKEKTEMGTEITKAAVGIVKLAAVKEKTEVDTEITKAAVGIATVVAVKEKTEMEEVIETLATVIKKTEAREASKVKDTKKADSKIKNSKAEEVVLNLEKALLIGN
jgi:uncharacterized protein YqkB